MDQATPLPKLFILSSIGPVVLISAVALLLNTGYSNLNNVILRIRMLDEELLERIFEMEKDLHETASSDQQQAQSSVTESAADQHTATISLAPDSNNNNSNDTIPQHTPQQQQPAIVCSAATRYQIQKRWGSKLKIMSNIEDQLHLLHHRAQLLRATIVLLYLSILVFAVTCVLIGIGEYYSDVRYAAIALFVFGIVLVVLAICVAAYDIMRGLRPMFYDSNYVITSKHELFSEQRLAKYIQPKPTTTTTTRETKANLTSISARMKKLYGTDASRALT